MSDDIDWSKAPEGATHYDAACTHPWLRDGTFPEYFRHKQWVRYDIASVGRMHIHRAVPRPPVSEGPLRAEEFGHLVEPDWSKAPEGTTHAAQDSADRWRWFKTNPASRDTLHICAGELMGGFPANLTLKPRPAPQIETLGEPTHPDNLAVDGFANAMRLRLATCRAAGKSGWDDPEQCPPQRLAEGLVRAVRAGKLVDVGNYAMMLWKRAQMTGQEHRVRDWLDEARRSDAAQHLGEPVEWDGTGLPPVGTVCEFDSKGTGWTEVTIAALVTKRSGTTFVLFELSYDYWHWESDPKRLRPILTPEQRAAKERDEAVAAMLDALKDNQSLRTSEVMGALYDAGWRKTEVK